METKRFNKYYKSNPHFRIENPNPEWAKKRGMTWDRGDCTVRALANSTGLSWVEAYDYMSERGRRDFCMPNDFTFMRGWLEEDGAKWTAVKAVKGKKRQTVLGFAETHPKGRYIIRIANHICACVNGVILDAWNPSEKAINGYVDMENFKIK